MIVGKGAWGSALGSILESKGINTRYLDLATTQEEWDASFKDSPVVILATPFSALESTLKSLKGRRVRGVVNASKGIDKKTLLTFTPLAAKSLRCPLATLSGPTFAQEVKERKPTACVVAGKDKKFIKEVARLFSCSTFRVYTNTDPRGVEVCGALKNVLAIACGISDGMGLGMNARAALLTRGLKEMEALVKIFGGKEKTVYGLTGVGDLWLTATGDLSRNRQLGLLLAQGQAAVEAKNLVKGPAEGLYTVEQVHMIAKKRKLDLPICEQVFRVCFENIDARTALLQLMNRELKDEDSRTVRHPKTKLSKK